MQRIIIGHAVEYHDEFVWDQIKTLQADMFAMGELKIKFCCYGIEDKKMVRPLITTDWIEDAGTMADVMDRGRAGCVCGCYTPIGDILAYALQEAPKAVIIIGDTFYGDLDQVMTTAKQLRAVGTRLFLIQQGREAETQGAYRALCEATGGAYFHFNPQAEHIEERLPEIFGAITNYVLNGLSGLQARNDASSMLLLEQMTATPFVMDQQKVRVERDDQ